MQKLINASIGSVHKFYHLKAFITLEQDSDNLSG